MNMIYVFGLFAVVGHMIAGNYSDSSSAKRVHRRLKCAAATNDDEWRHDKSEADGDGLPSQRHVTGSSRQTVVPGHWITTSSRLHQIAAA